MQIPYWALGWHIGSSFYESLDSMELMKRSMEDAGLPFDSVLHGIDYQDHARMFTTHSCKYDCVRPTIYNCIANNISDWVSGIQNQGYKYQIAMNPSISTSNWSSIDNYDIYQNTEPGTFIKTYHRQYDPQDKIDFVGKLFTIQPDSKCTHNATDPEIKDNVAFVDFISGRGRQFWKNQIKDFQQKLNFDGVFLTESEPVNFGEKNCDELGEFNFPYLPKLLVDGDLFADGICPEAGHDLFAAAQFISHHYAWHNEFTMFGVIETARAMYESDNHRAVVSSRASAHGTGLVAAHWNGDSDSEDWGQLQLAITNMFDMSLFNVPQSGTSACGSIGNPLKNDDTIELCVRWHQLASFLPLARNFDSDLTEGIEFDKEIVHQYPSVNADIRDNVRDSILQRYELLPSLYNLFYKHVSQGEPVFRSLFMNFPKDPDAYEVKDQFMIGNHVMVVPAITKQNGITPGEGTTYRDAYLPQEDKWFVYGEKAKGYSAKPGHQNIGIPMDWIPVYIAPKTILVTHDIISGNQGLNGNTIRNTKDARELPLTIHVYEPDNNAFFGTTFFWDDGESINTIKDKKCTERTFTASHDSLKSQAHVGDCSNGYDAKIGKVVFHNLPDGVLEVTVNGRPIVENQDYIFEDSDPIQGNYSMLTINLDVQ